MSRPKRTLSELAHPHIRALQPYPPGKPIEEVERELGIQGSVKLASNESPLGPSRCAVEAIQRGLESLNRYPDGSCYYLREALAKQLGVAGGQLIFGTGSSEILELVAKCFLGPGDEAVFPWPSFAMYPIVVRGMGAVPVQVPLDVAYRASVRALLDAVTDHTRVLILTNPNNPTGTSIGAAELATLVRELPDDVVFVCDEAYREYARRPDFPDTLALLRERRTLLSLRTFSKVYGLAGLRVGYAIGDPELIGLLERARHPFNVNSLAQLAATAALGDAAHVERVRALTLEGLAQLERGLDALGLHYAESDANFLLVEVGDDAAGIYQRLLEQGVITRTLGAFGLTRHLRVTVGLPAENERLLDSLRRELAR